MSIYDVLRELHPGADPFVDFELRDDLDGQGIKIAKWDSKLGPMPDIKAGDFITASAEHEALKVKNKQIETIKVAALSGLAGIKDFETLQLVNELLSVIDNKNLTPWAQQAITNYNQAVAEMAAVDKPKQ